MLNFSKRINVKRQQWFLGEGEGVFVTAEKVKDPFIFGQVLHTAYLIGDPWQKLLLLTCWGHMLSNFSNPFPFLINLIWGCLSTYEKIGATKIVMLKYM